MYQPRTVTSHPSWRDSDGVKLYAIASQHRSVNVDRFYPQLATMKQAVQGNWLSTAAFAILHAGEGADYLVLAWWGNDNELFTQVAVHTGADWVIDASRFSFCLYDMSVMWQERAAYIKTMDCAAPSLAAYQACRG